MVGGPDGWYKPSNGNGEVTFISDASASAVKPCNTRAGILQNLDRDASGCFSLVLRVRIQAIEHRLTGTGYNDREAPNAVFVKYTDANGMVRFWNEHIRAWRLSGLTQDGYAMAVSAA